MSLQAIRPQKQKVKNKQKQKQKQQSDVDTSQLVSTYNDSLQVVKLLLTTGVGCITFLRGVFPERVFSDEKIDTIKVPGLVHEKQSSVRVKALRKGELPEVDKLLDYLEHGVGDAIAKGYLKTLMFAIYLDPNQPNNVVELYTFNFVYRTETQVTTAFDGSKQEKTYHIPEVEVRDQLRGMQIGSSRGDYDAPSTSENSASTSNVGPQPAGTDPKKWTVSEVRKQVQVLVKRLIALTQILNELPKQRYVTFKLYYNPETPEDYEPPYFHSVDHEKSRFKMGTKDPEAQPEMDVVGRVDSGHHCLTLRMASVSDQLPDMDVHRSQGTPIPKLTAEAAQRPILWDGEEMTIDETCDVSFETKEEKDAAKAVRRPIGKVDTETGMILPWSTAADGAEGMQDDESEASVDVETYGAPTRKATIIYALPPDQPRDPEATMLTESELLRQAAAETPIDYTHDTEATEQTIIPAPQAARTPEHPAAAAPISPVHNVEVLAETESSLPAHPTSSGAQHLFVPPAAVGNNPFPAESYMFTQTIPATQVVPDASLPEPESEVPSSPPSVAQGQSETIPREMQRQYSTFTGLDSIFSKAKEASPLLAPPQPAARSVDPLGQDTQMDFSQTQETQVVPAAAPAAAEDVPMEQDSDSLVIKVSEANKRRQDRPIQRIETPLPEDETEEIAETEPVIPLADSMQHDQTTRPDTPVTSSGHKPLPKLGTPKRPIEIPDSPPESDLSELEDEDDSLPSIKSIFAPKTPQKTTSSAPVSASKSATSAKSGSGEKKPSVDEKGDEYNCDCVSKQEQKGGWQAIACDVCDFWFHTCCHGYEQDAQLPESFTCYKCLLSKTIGADQSSFYENCESSDAFMALSSLCLFRKAAAQLYAAGDEAEGLLATFHEPLKFANFVHADMQDALEIWKKLKKEEYVLVKQASSRKDSTFSESSSSEGGPSYESNRKSRASRSKAEVLTLNRDPAKLKELHKRYFRPGKGEEAEIMRDYKLVAPSSKPTSTQQTPKKAKTPAPESASTTATPARKKLVPMQASPQRIGSATPKKLRHDGEQLKLDLSTIMAIDDAEDVEQTGQDFSAAENMRFVRAGTAAVTSSQPAANSANAEGDAAQPSRSISATAPNVFSQLALRSSGQRALELPAQPIISVSTPGGSRKRAAEDDTEEDVNADADAIMSTNDDNNDKAMAEAPSSNTSGSTTPTRSRFKRAKTSMPSPVKGKDDDPPTEPESEGEEMDETA